MRPRTTCDQALVTLALAVSGAAGCLHYQVNAPLGARASGPRYDFESAPSTEQNTDELFVCLALSGGGTRAAALSYGVLQELRDTAIVWKGKRKSLLDEVDCISAVSGGAFTAAYYGLFGERLFEDFRPKLLDVDLEGELFSRVAQPSSWIRMASPYYDRIDLTADYFDEQIFEKKTFGEMAARGRRPFVIINSTNMATGGRFEFTQNELDFIGSDLSGYPVARAVAASSAFPILLSPITLANHPAKPGGERAEAMKSELKNAEESFVTNRERYQRGRNHALYSDATKMPFLHLMDGGLADNIGVRAIEAAYKDGFIGQRLNTGRIEKLLVIVVNARVEKDSGISQSESPPGLSEVVFKTATVAMESYSFESIRSLTLLLNERKMAQSTLAACRRKLEAHAQCVRQEYTCAPEPVTAPECSEDPIVDFAATVEPFVVHLELEAIKDIERRRAFLSLPTTFSLDKGKVDDLIEVGGELLRDDPVFKSALSSIGESNPQKSD